MVFPYYLRVPTIQPIAILNPSYRKSQIYPIQQLHSYSPYLVLPELVEVFYSLISTTRIEKRFILASLFSLTLVLFLLKPSAASMITLLLICIVWGTSSTAFNVACQSETMLATNENTNSVAMSIFSGIFNLGIGLGSFIGGQTINLLNIQSIGYIAGIIAILGIIFYIRRR